MPKIFKLSPHVADLIAAGEVVERPGSVIKELIENSIDAGASSITVEIRGGGMTYMRVTDNGCGMSYEDSGTAFLRHATSKLRDEHGLEAIGTLGFRGEALAATAAVSKIELITREKGSGEGTRLVIEGGDIIEKTPYGCPEGTTIIVRGLFYNTPARLKFMKSDKAEGANITSAVIRCAISHPDVAVRYIKDGKEEYHTPGDGLMESCMYSIFGRDFTANMLKAETSDDDVAVRGYVSAPLGCRGNRSFQFFFVNGRYIKSKTLQAALEQGYRNVLFNGKFPACILHITVSPAAVDVNVHPAKTEVRFLNEKKVFDGVYYAVLGALQQRSAAAELNIKAPKKAEITEPPQKAAPVIRPAPSYVRTVSPSPRSAGDTAPETAPRSFSPVPGVGAGREASSSSTARSENATGGQLKSPFSSGGFVSGIHGKSESRGYTFNNNSTVTPYQTKLSEASSPKIPPVSPVHAPPQVSPAPPEEKEDVMPYRIIGEGLSTYIIAEQGNSLFLIDKHAAHERMIFDKLKAGGVEIMTQCLLTPLVCNIGSENTALVMENQELIQEFGFEIDRFGEDCVAIRQIPSDIGLGDAESALDDICEKLRTGRADPAASRDGILHVIACKAAIKAGRRTETEQVRTLVEKVLTGEIRFCPHGRPVVMELTKQALDKNFKRI